MFPIKIFKIWWADHNDLYIWYTRTSQLSNRVAVHRHAARKIVIGRPYSALLLAIRKNGGAFHYAEITHIDVDTVDEARAKTYELIAIMKPNLNTPQRIRAE